MTPNPQASISVPAPRQRAVAVRLSDHILQGKSKKRRKKKKRWRRVGWGS